MKSNEERSLSVMEWLKNIAYNTKYNILNYFEGYGKNSIVQANNEVYILGRKMTISQNNRAEVQKQIYQIFETTPWITYRSGFPMLVNENSGASYVSDTGWGCMVRVGQMLFAEIFKYHKRMKTKEEILEMLTLFSDVDSTQPFSIHKIAELAKEEYNLKPGQWYNPSQITFILNKLYEIYLQKEQSYKLKIIVSNSSNLYFESLSDAMLSEKTKCDCQHKSLQFVCPNQNCNQVKNEVAIIIMCRLGLRGPQQQHLKVLQKLMEMQFCQGVIGGKPEKALYFIGKQSQHFIYLDPHYVQEAEKNNKPKSETHFCESFRMCKKTSIDASIGICFYLRDIEQLNKFYQQINKIKNENEDFFIFVQDQIPSYQKSNQNIGISSDAVIEIL